MAKERYVCYSCKRVEEFDSRRKTHPCFICGREMSYLGINSVVGGELYNAYLPYGATEYKIPDGVETMETGAFQGKETLEKVTFPATLKEISWSCFFLCKNLKSVHIPGSVKTLGGFSFSGCFSLEEVVLQDGLEVIGKDAFSSCRNIKQIALPSSLTTIGENAFQGVPFKYIALPKSVQKIGEGAFTDDYGKTKATFLVAKNSYAERYVIEHGYKYHILDCKEGFASTKNVYDGTLFVAGKLGKTLKVGDDTQRIAKEAFKNCEKIETVAFPASLLEIQDYAFAGCTSIKSLKFTNGIERIARGAFQSCKEIESLEFPNSLTEIQDYAFEWCTAIREVKFENGIKHIGMCAFQGCKKIERLEFPSSLTEIQDYAFQGCTTIRELKFSDGIRRIGAGAFTDTDLLLIDLPRSVVSIAADAFPPNCVISIAGEMPFYYDKVAQIRHRQGELGKKERELESAKAQLQSTEKLCIANVNPPDVLEKIREYKQKIDEINNGEYSKERSLKIEELGEVDARLYKIASELNALGEDRKKCFFWAISKKKELDHKIANKKTERQKIQEQIAKLNHDIETIDAKKTADLAKIEGLLRPLENEYRAWTLEKEKTIKAHAEYDKRVRELSAEIERESAAIAADEDALHKARQKWAADKEQAQEALRIAEEKRTEEKKREQEAERKRKLETEKKKLLDEISLEKLPAYAQLPSFEFAGEDAIAEESLLNDAYLSMIHNRNEISRISIYNEYVTAHGAQVERIKKINKALGIEENDGVEKYSLEEMPEKTPAKLPDRFLRLNSYFSKQDAWKQVKKAAECIAQKRDQLDTMQAELFAGTSPLCLQANNNILLLFPYCAVICRPESPMSVLTYNRIKLDISISEKEEDIEKIPPDGELIGQRYAYVNKDGTVNKRYKYNPLLKTVRFTTVIIKAGRNKFSAPVKTLQAARKLESAFNQYTAALCKGAWKTIYSMVCASTDTESIESAIKDFTKAEKMRKELALKAAEEEKKRLEEERLAAQEAAEEKRREIIRRQREINEERKRQEAEKAAELKRVEKLFGDDFSDEAEETAPEDKTSAAMVPLEVVGNGTITNTVFKVILRPAEGAAYDALTAYFITDSGEIISNRKMIQLTEPDKDVTVGFILNSGIDFTSMKKCFMRFDFQGETLGDIPFKMNISFFSDF